MTLMSLKIKKVERNVDQSCFFQRVETMLKLRPQRKQSQFTTARPAAVNITGRPCGSESKREDEIDKQPCSSQSIPKLPSLHQKETIPIW